MSTQDHADTYAAHDALREQKAVAHSERMGWTLLRHADILRALHDHETFSNRVSHHLSVPNGMDPPEHTAYRRHIEPYFGPDRMAAFEPECRSMAAALVRQALAAGPEVEMQSALGFPFAARVQCRFLGWPEDMEQALLDWASRNLAAIRDLDRAALAENAHRFEDLIQKQLQIRRDAGARPGDDLTARLMSEQVNGRDLLDEEIVSILRNWTAGEIATISASVGIVALYLAAHPGIQQALRADRSRIPYAVDEILRIQGPLLTNRRKTVCPAHIGGRDIPAGERVTIYWTAGNRDGRAFDEPLAFRWDRDPKKNLLYGAGIHVCPGAPLARMELRLIVEELLAQTRALTRARDRVPVPADFPLGGYAAVWIKLDAK